MDAVELRRGRQTDKPIPDSVEIPKTGKCRYCKALFNIDPRHPNKEFCKEGHRKLYWRYGQHSVTKVAERMQRANRKLIDAEIKALRKEAREAEARMRHEFEQMLEGATQPTGMLLRELNERVRVLEARGGAAGAAS